jgi:7-cyano-7-deazaguanine synthase in queuosine biosynthesis
LEFRESVGWPKVKKASARRGKKKEKIGSINHFCLFSGGLDSLVGAIDLLSSGERVALIGHHGAGVTNKVQRGLLETLTKKFKEKVVPLMFHVQPKKLKSKDGEPTMRSRSFLFFALGVAMVESIEGGDTLTVAENGLISLNVPLTPSRSGSCSTRTTHPHYVVLYRKLLKRVGIKTKLSLPYRFMTKGEMLTDCNDKALLRATASQSMSCSHSESGRFQGFRPGQHCGYCVPCIIRRAAMKKAGLTDKPPNIDVLTEDVHYKEDRGRDLRAFQMALERERAISEARSLFRVLATGPLPPIDASSFAELYRRGISEVRAFFTHSEKKQ